MPLKIIILEKLSEFDITDINKSDVDIINFDKPNNILKELDDICKEKYKYDLNYAFSNAHLKISRFYDDFMVEFEDEKKKYKSSDSEDHHISAFVDRLYKHITKLHIHYRAQKTILILTSLALSLTLILSIHWLTDHFIGRFEALIDSFIIVVVLGVVKLFLEERVLRERIERRGWVIYKKSIELTKSNFAKVILSYILIKKANDSGLLLKQMVGKHNKFLHSLQNHIDYEPDE